MTCDWGCSPKPFGTGTGARCLRNLIPELNPITHYCFRRTFARTRNRRAKLVLRHTVFVRRGLVLCIASWNDSILLHWEQQQHGAVVKRVDPGFKVENGTESYYASPRESGAGVDHQRKNKRSSEPCAERRASNEETGTRLPTTILHIQTYFSLSPLLKSRN